MDYLWTPWRFQYLASARQESDCVFCRLTSEKDGDRNLILLRKNYNFLVLNKFPYTTGHLMIVSLRHIATLADSSAGELEEMVQLARDCEAVLQKVYKPDGFNIGLNVGVVAGAGVAGHLHLHVVPRWKGDANFISIIGETRVIPEELSTTFERLYPHFHPD